MLAKCIEMVYNIKALGEKIMSVYTNNAYGQIFISDLAIARVAANVAKETYGIVELAEHRHEGIFAVLDKFTQNWHQGVKVTTYGNRIYVDISVMVKYGVSISAVAEALREELKYKLEVFTGMLVDTVSVNVIGVKQ